MNDLSLVVELLVMLVTDIRIATLLTLLLAAAIIDVRSYRIPNVLTFSGIVIGLVISAVSPASIYPGFGGALAGMVVGFLLTVPFYALRAMGAGDVKLMAMVGTFLGVPVIIYVCLTAFMVGGISAILLAARRRALMKMIGNVKGIAYGGMLSALSGSKPSLSLDSNVSVGKLPYGLSICIGTAVYLVGTQIGLF